MRQAERLAAYVQREIPSEAPVLVGGDFNDWNEGLDAVLAATGLRRACGPAQHRAPRTFPARLPLFALDRFYTRGLHCQALHIPTAQGVQTGSWREWSDHLPLCGHFLPE
jgi:endonuclease/exonuclease/phosphatase family metal-dependent hydrolase